MASPTKLDPRVALASPYARTERQTRRPQHPFNVETKPFQIQPVMLAPVLPGETLKSLLLQSQVWSDPLNVGLKNTGWWCEYNVFYIKHRDMPGYETAADGLGKDLVDMFVQNEALTTHVDSDGNVATYCPPGGVDFTLNALRRVVDEYFRDEGENYATAEIDGIPITQIYGRGRSDAFDKLTLAADYEDHRIPLSEGSDDGEIYVGDQMSRAFNEWATAHDAGLIDMDYDDWMKTYGGSARETQIDRVQYHKPEDIAYIRNFTYPTNTVEPATGVPAVAVGWRVANTMRKSYRFEEPGWLLVTQTVRPKVYLGNQQGLVAAMMQTRDSWLPAILNHETDVGHVVVDDLVGPLAATMSADYMLSFRDLLLYGEQFINHSPTGKPGFMALPTTTAGRRYAAPTQVMGMFADTTNGRFRADGMISLNIVGRQRETTHNKVLYRA